MTMYALEPEVAGGFGPATVIDRSVVPYVIEQLEYEFDGWLGDDLIAFTSVTLVTLRVRDALVEAGVRGVRFAPVVVSRSSQFEEVHVGGELPEWVWMQVVGVPHVDDAWIGDRRTLMVSERMFRVLEQFNLQNCIVTPITD